MGALKALTAIFQHLLRTQQHISDADEACDDASLAAQGLIQGARVRLQHIEPEQDKFPTEEFIVEYIQTLITMLQTHRRSMSLWKVLALIGFRSQEEPRDRL